MHRKGRPRVLFTALVYSAVYRVFLRMPGRDVASPLIKLAAEGYLGSLIHENTLSDYLNDERLSPILQDLIVKSSLPLASLEGDSIALDSTYFAGSRFVRAYDIKYHEQTEKRITKLHFACGTRSHIITAALITRRDKDDLSQLPELLDTTAKAGRAIQEVLADKAYTTVENYEKIASLGAKGFLPFRYRRRQNPNEPPRTDPSPVWREALLRYQTDREEFLKHYHKRSNAETVVSMLKTNFGDNVRCRTDTSMANDVYCKIICHNICCLIRSMYELNIMAEFFPEPGKEEAAE